MAWSSDWQVGCRVSQEFYKYVKRSADRFIELGHSNTIEVTKFDVERYRSTAPFTSRVRTCCWFKFRASGFVTRVVVRPEQIRSAWSHPDPVQQVACSGDVPSEGQGAAVHLCAPNSTILLAAQPSREGWKHLPIIQPLHG